ncbi:MAG: DUF58 domain-containing protein [Oryzihumus sp.]
MPTPPPPVPWRPTSAHVRACVGGAALALAATWLRRPDLLVLASPLLVVALWSALSRPGSAPQVDTRVAPRTVREGEAVRWTAALQPVPGLEQATAKLAAGDFQQVDPPTRTVTVAAPGAPASDALPLTLAVRSTRWGRRTVGPAVVVAHSPWGAFRWGAHEVEPVGLSTLPVPTRFDTAALMPHPNGLVGLNRSSRPGDGSEFASIRPFQLGDRLRRIHWPVSLRTGSLHVTSSWADQDSHVLLIVDALNDLGPSEGLEGAASSLDTTVRAAGAMAEHYLHRGDRVSLRVLGSTGTTRVPAATGKHHLRRVLDALASIEVASRLEDDPRHAMTGVSAGTVVVLLSPLVSPVALSHAVTLARRGLTVIVIDTLPDGLTGDDPKEPFAGIAWRVRLLERRRELQRVQAVGVPVVAWQGPGSLDQVLRDVTRRAAAPRMAQR